ncbi:hypothetical protein [Brevundimonas goettingensis]|uniref:Uncharacterized protein n=1 Tax=Brevundimonas goettingensis TaxID=2774190 RepID=A0A975C1R1_9CAUL|nr:hypothetical protein [Brevundimonas goettingensis]QTC90859.1 hypothetical protein IFJ75_16775 [Brevundimonas goettingensis]
MTMLTEQEWEERFIPIIKQNDDWLLFDDSDPDECVFLDAVGDNRIWTQVEADDAIQYVPGRWTINAVGYIVTMKSWAENEADLTVVIELDMGCEAFANSASDGDGDE